MLQKAKLQRRTEREQAQEAARLEAQAAALRARPRHVTDYMSVE